MTRKFYYRSFIGICARARGLPIWVQSLLARRPNALHNLRDGLLRMTTILLSVTLRI